MKCFCRCHSEPDLTERAFPYAGVDVRDAVAAVFACRSCENAHCAALLDTTPLRPLVVPTRGMQVITPEGKTLSWDAYQREMEKRPDAWRADQGEGPEA